MYSKEGLFKRLPKKYHERVKDLEKEIGLVDDCKFIITLQEPYYFEDGGLTFPCKNYKEAIYIIKTSVKNEKGKQWV